MKTTAWLSKRLVIINQFWLVKYGNRFNTDCSNHCFAQANKCRRKVMERVAVTGKAAAAEVC